MTADEIERFWSRVDKDGPTMPHMDTPCWIMPGSTKGYPHTNVDGRSVKASRVALEIDGRPPGALLACHRCDNPRCVRADHIYPGTVSQNAADRKRRLAEGRAANTGGANYILLSLTVAERADVDAVRGTIPAATWCRDAVVQVVALKRAATK